MVDEIIKLLDEKVNEVYLYFQEKLDIRDGFIYPEDAFKQDEIIKSLANTIEKVLKYEKEEDDGYTHKIINRVLDAYEKEGDE